MSGEYAKIALALVGAHAADIEVALIEASTDGIKIVKEMMAKLDREFTEENKNDQS